MRLTGWSARARFYRQLGQLLRSGLAMDVALPLAADAAGGDYPRRAAVWATGCAGGRPLSVQLHDEPPTVVALLRAGERSGRVPEICERIAELTDHARALRASVLSRLWYPAVLLHAALIAPQLPAVLLHDGSWWSLLLGPAMVWLTIGAVVVALRTGMLDALAARVLLAWPWRGLTLPLLADRVCLVVGAGHAAGLLHREALELAADACGNRHLAAAVRVAAVAVEAHRLPSLAAALDAAGLDRTTVALVTAAEAGGRLDEGFRHAAVQNRETFARRADIAVRVLGGVIYAAMALIVAFTVVQMYANVYGEALQQVQAE